MSEPEITLGEVVRTLQRLETTVNRMADSLAQLATVDVRVTNAEDHIRQLREDVHAVNMKSAVISGGVSALAFMASLWPWHK